MADICLLVEGAYPYVTGGVSAWLHSLVSNLPDLTFALTYIGARPDQSREALYHLPANVVEFREVFVNDPDRITKHQRRIRPSPVAWQNFHTLHEAVAVGKPYDGKTFLPLLRESGFARLTTTDLFHAPESWEMLIKLYQLYAPKESFVDFFWTFRFTYLPIFTVFETILPPARVYHAVSTGYSGLFGALAKIRTGRPLIVTEHGLYTREREIEIAQATWMDQPAWQHGMNQRRLGFFQEWWLNIYHFMEKMTYDSADALISITRVNQHYQLKRGADPAKSWVIPNGIDIERLANLRPPIAPTAEYVQPTDRFLIGFVGRVVPIKDVKTWIRAIKIVQQTIAHLTAYIVGPTEEDPAYFHECCRLVELLDLTTVVQFTGPADVSSYYSKLDLLVLTSLSEGQPLVVLEGNCAGLPVIATDVGACRELLLGVSPEDQAIGASGIITPVASPDKTAEAIIHLWRDRDLRSKMGRAGQERTRRFYRQEQLYRSYDELYRQYIAQPTLAQEFARA